MKARNRGYLFLAVLLLLLLLGGAYVAWTAAGNEPLPEAKAALRGDDAVLVTTEPWLVFRPPGDIPTTGLILYPGGLVPPEAYAPPARTLAGAGYLVAIVPMPLNLAVTAPDRATDVISAYPDVQRWVIGGHSLGGAMAARFAAENPEVVAGLVLWASYPASDDVLSGASLQVVSIYGSEDGLATPAEVEDSAALLPADTHFVQIEGGNHTQFGYYGDGPQRGDNAATIDRETQQAAIVAATGALLRKLTQPANGDSSSP